MQHDRNDRGTATAATATAAVSHAPQRLLPDRSSERNRQESGLAGREKRPDRGLAESQEQILTTLATDFKAYLQVRPDARLTLTGHADPRGGDKYNQALSERRVGSVKNFLVGQGVPESAIDTKAVGDSQPLSKDEVKDLIQKNPELTDDERKKMLRQINDIYLAQNRRVDITLNTGQESVQLYPFNAHDSGTLLSTKPQAHAKKQPAAPKKK